MEIEIEGLRGLEAKLNNLAKEVNKAGSRGMQAIGMEIVAEAKMNLKRNGSIVSSGLIGSGKVQKLSDGSVDAGFFSTSSEQGYAAAYEYGRRAGKQPPIKALIPWVAKRNRGNKALKSFVLFKNARARKHKNRTEADFIEMAARALAIHIGKHGTKPHPFFTPAVEKVSAKLEDIMSKYINEATK